MKKLVVAMEKAVGRRVLIVAKDHPHVGKTGVIARFEVALVLNQPACVIKLDEGRDVMVFSSEAIKFL